jgi:hypothetical protein
LPGLVAAGHIMHVPLLVSAHVPEKC